MSARDFMPDALPHWDAQFLERAEVRHEYSLGEHLADKALRAGVTPARALQSRSARAAGAGLVPVPTTVPQGLPAALAASEAAAAALGVRLDLGAFTLDPAARRLAHLRMHVGMSARAHAVCAKGHRSDVAWMVTLTYAPGKLWRPEHLSDALRQARKWCQKRGIAFRYVWIAEVQDERYAALIAAGERPERAMHQCIHYHAVIWLPVGRKCPRFDSRGWWSHGMTRTDAPPAEVKHAAAYLMHYLKKDKDLSGLPKGARAYGVGGLDHSLRRARRWLGLPRFVQGNSSILDDWRRADGGGWIAPNGVRFCSEFASVIVAGVRCLVRVATHGRTFAVGVGEVCGGPFSWLSDRARSLAIAA